MSLPDLIKPIEVTLHGLDGEVRTFRIGRMPYLAGGREVCADSDRSLVMPGEYKRNEELIVKALAYVEVKTADGQFMRLSTRAMIDNHIPDVVIGRALEEAVLEHQTGFSRGARARAFAASLMTAVPPELRLKISTLLQRLSSAPASQP